MPRTEVDRYIPVRQLELSNIDLLKHFYEEAKALIEREGLRADMVHLRVISEVHDHAK